MRNVTLVERVAYNLELIKQFDGDKVIGKRGKVLKRFWYIRKKLEEKLRVEVHLVDRKVIIIDRECPFRLKPQITVYSINKDGELTLEEELVEKLNNVQNWLLLNHKKCEELFSCFEKLESLLRKVSYDCLVRKEEFNQLSSKLQKLAFAFSYVKSSS